MGINPSAIPPTYRTIIKETREQLLQQLMGADAVSHSQTVGGGAWELLCRRKRKDWRNQRGKGHTRRIQPTESTDWDLLRVSQKSGSMLGVLLRSFAYM